MDKIFKLSKHYSKEVLEYGEIIVYDLDHWMCCVVAHTLMDDQSQILPLEGFGGKVLL